MATRKERKDRLAAAQDASIEELEAEFRTELETQLVTAQADEEIPNEELAGIVADEVDTEEIRRYLRARKRDVEGAVTQYIETQRWRFRESADDILTYPDADEAIYQAICPHGNHGYARDGSPIYIEKTGNIDLPLLLEHLSPEKLIRRHIRQMEIALKRMREETERRGELVEQQMVILDLAGLSLRPNSTGLSIFKETIRIDQAYYPERLNQIFLINAPWIFTPLWALLRPWLDPVTRDKFHVVGSGFQSVLDEFIDRDNLPVEYGGTLPAVDGPFPVGSEEAKTRALEKASEVEQRETDQGAAAVVAAVAVVSAAASGVEAEIATATEAAATAAAAAAAEENSPR